MEDDFGRKHDKYAIKMMKREGASDNKKNFANRRSSAGSSVHSNSEDSPSRDEDDDTRVIVFSFCYSFLLHIYNLFTYLLTYFIFYIEILGIKKYSRINASRNCNYENVGSSKFSKSS